MSFLNKTDIKNLAILFLLSLIISTPYFLYSPKHALLSVLLLMVFAIVSKIVFAIVAVYSLLINAFFLHIIPNWGAISLDSRIQAALLSASYEKKEYLNAYFGLTDSLIMLLYIAATLFAIYYIVKKVQLSSLLKKVFLSVSTIAFASILVFFPTLEILERLQIAHLPLRVYSNYESLNVVSKRKEFLDLAEKKVLKCDNLLDKIIFIQGESVNKKHMSLYGYERKTTPFLDSIKTFKFDAISPTNQTRYSIPLELTEARVNSFDKFYESKSIVSTLSECGYTTYWISNQGESSETDTVITSIGSEADYAYFLNKLDYTTAGLDGEILKKLKSIGTETPKKQAIFIHLLGSHFVYSDRYPQNKAEWEKNDIVSQYDNTVLYTDFIISEIYKLFEDYRSLFVYLSDHGEVVEQDIHGHGYSPSVKEEYEVPLVFWSTQLSKLPELHSLTQGKTINTESLNDIFDYLVGVNPELNVSYSQEVMSVQPDNIVNFSDLKYNKP